VTDSSNGAGAEGYLARAIEDIGDGLARIRARREELVGALQLTREEERKLTTALRALAPEHPLAAVSERQKRRQSQAGIKPGSVKPASFQTVWAWVRERGDESFSIREAAEAIGAASEDPVRRTLYALRDGEAIRLAGREHRHGGTVPAQVFRLLDVEAGERAVEANAERYAQSGAPGTRSRS
jgi:hypothetical protein